MQQKTKLKVHKEEIYHFTCSECKKWWSVADAPKQKKRWFCPWCGTKQSR